MRIVINHILTHGSKKLFILICLIFSSGLVLSRVPLLSKKQLASPPPKIIRTCCSFGVDMKITGIPFFTKTDITSIDDLGKHSYLGDKIEGNGIVYTRRGGFIDIAHLRDYADWTAYLYAYITENENRSSEIYIDLGSEGGDKSLTIFLSEDIEIDFYQLAGKVAYDLSVWHEIATWFGSSYIPFLPERYSSFSPEDLYSNLLGVKLGILALKSDLEYEEAMTKLLSEMLNDLSVVPTVADTYKAMNKVENIWWTSAVKLPSRHVLLDRYFGSPEHNYLIPWIVPGEDEVLPLYKLNKPILSSLNIYELRIDANYKFPVEAILSISKKRAITQKDFSVFIAYITKDVINSEMGMSSSKSQDKKRKQTH